MHQKSFRLLLPVLTVFFAISCSTAKKATQATADIRGLQFLSQYDLPFNLAYNNTIVGGLSGIDYDAKNNQYYLISDDRSDRNPARFYTAKIFFSEKKIDSISFTGVKYMLRADGKAYPNNKQDARQTPDPEAIRFNPVSGMLAWSSEGERIVTDKDTVLGNPSVVLIRPGGGYIDSFILPANLVMHAMEKGPRRNGVLEGMTFADNYQTLFVNVEEPLYEDGPRAEVTEGNAFIRMYRFDGQTRKNTAQYAYKLSPVAYPAVPESAFKINGVPDILSLGNNKLLVIERSFSTGRIPCTVKVFIADLNGATDISNMQLNNNDGFVPAAKKLLLNMDDLGIYTDNIEGVTFGPRLPNGHKTLLFIADNNFNPLEKAQVLLFEVIE